MINSRKTICLHQAISIFSKPRHAFRKLIPRKVWVQVLQVGSTCLSLYSANVENLFRWSLWVQNFVLCSLDPSVPHLTEQPVCNTWLTSFQQCSWGSARALGVSPWCNLTITKTGDWIRKPHRKLVHYCIWIPVPIQERASAAIACGSYFTKQSVLCLVLVFILPGQGDLLCL